MMLPLAVATLMGLLLLAAGTVWLPERKRLRAVQSRLSRVTLAYSATPPRIRFIRRPELEVVSVLQRQIQALLGYRRARAPHYPTPLRVVASVAAVPAVIIVWLLGKVVGPLALAGAPLCWAILVRLYYRRLEQRLCGKLFVQFPDALAMIVRAVRVGVPVTEAVRLVAAECQVPTAIEFRQLSDEVAIGVALEQALRDMGNRNKLPEYRFFATALALQSQTGGGLTETLETLADTIRKRVAARDRGHALASEARTSCYMLAALPFVVGAGMYLTNPDYISVLFTSSGGNKLLGAAAASLGTGLFTMRTIIRKSLT